MYNKIIFLILITGFCVLNFGCGANYGIPMLETVSNSTSSSNTTMQTDMKTSQIPTIPYSDRVLIAVKNFDCAIDSLENKGTQLTAAITTELINAQAFRVVEREKLNEIIEEQALSMTGALEDDMVESGGLKGLSDGFVLTGTITEYGTKSNEIGIGEYKGKQISAVVALDGRLIQPDTGEIMSAVKGYGECSKRSFHAQKFNIGNNELDSAQLDEATRIAINNLIVNLTNQVYGF